MSELVEVYNKLKTFYPEALEVSQVNQSGISLSFDGLKQSEYKKDIALFSLKISLETLAQILPLLDELRLKTLDEENLIFGVEIFKNIEFIGFENSLYNYSLNLEIPIFRQKVDEYLGSDE